MEWPPHEWNRGQLLAVALARNPDLVVARAEVQTQLAREVTAAQLPNPGLTLQSEYALRDSHPWLYGIGLDWLLRSPNRRRLDREAARLDTQGARLRVMSDAWSVRRELVKSLSEAEGARRQLTLLERLASADDRLVQLERRRVGAGEDPPTLLGVEERARIEIEQQQAAQRALESGARASVAKALGVPPEALDGVALLWSEWGAPPPVSDQELQVHREEALLSRSDLRAAIGEYAKAETKLQLAVARQYPEFTLEPGYYWDHGIAKFPLDIGFDLPFNGNKGEIAEAKAERELAGARLLAVQADIYNEIGAALRAEQIARMNLAAAERQSEATRRQLDQVSLGVRLGASDALEQAGAELVVMRAEIDLVAMRAELQRSRNALEDSLHAPLSGPELSLSAMSR